MIILNEAHLRRLIGDYVSYYHVDRIHGSLKKDTPAKRPVSSKPDKSGCLVSLRRASVACITDTTGRRLPEEVTQ